MCRVFSFISVNPILLDDVLRRPINAITQQVPAEFQGEWFLNADGFGITWHSDARSKFNPFDHDQSADKQQSESEITSDPVKIYDGPLLPYVHGPHPAIYKTTIAKPLNDPTFLSLCANVSSKCIFAHLRAADAPPVAITNNHPFVFGRHCLMHNGLVSDFGQIRKEMLEHVSEGFASMIEGGTDTEHLAALYMTYLCEPADFLGADKHYPATSMWKALKAATHKVEAIQTKRGLTPDNYLNICATDGESQVSLCYRSKVSPSTPPFDLWVSCDVGDTLDRKPYGHAHGGIFKDNRSEDAINKAAHDLRKHAKHAVERGHDGKPIGIAPELQRTLEKEEQIFPSQHGPHVAIASEPTTIDQGWYKLCNRDVVLVDTVRKGKIHTLSIKPETF